MSSENTHQNKQLLHDFYSAFARGDADTMAASYHDDAEFSDAVFRGLDAPGVRAMWRMLNEQGSDLRVEFSNITANDTSGSAHWDAYYTFSPTGKKVHNSIDATFEFRDGLIYRHVDSFSFWRWSKQSLGVAGLLLGWTPILPAIVRSQAAKQLATWREKQGSRPTP